MAGGSQDDDDAPPIRGGSRDDRLGAGFDFLLYQKKAGLQQIADDATKEAEAKEEDKGADAGPVQQVQQQRSAKLDKRRPPGPMYLSWKQMEDEENERLKQSGKGDLPCKDDFFLRMRVRLGEMYANHLLPLENMTPFKDLYDDPLDDGDFTAMPFIMFIPQPAIYKERFLEKFLDDAYIIRDPRRRYEDKGDRTASGYDPPIDVDGVPGARKQAGSEETADNREKAGFDFLLYQKKAGLQQVAEDAKAEEEKSAAADAGPMEDTGPIISKGPKEIKAKLVTWKDKFVFVVTLDTCFGAPGTCRDYRAEDAEREKRLREEAEEKKKEEARQKKKKEDKEKKKKAEEAKKKAEAAIHDPFGLGWHKPGDEPAGGKKGGKKDRKKGGFDFLLFQKKAGLQEVANNAAEEEKAADTGGQEQQQAGGWQEADDQGSEDFIEVDEFLPGREVLKTIPKIMNFGSIITKLGPGFVHDFLRGYQTESYTLTKFNALMCPDVPDTDDTPEPNGYCWEAAIRFFGQKSDRIFILADLRRDMTNKFASTLEAIADFHGKVSVIYLFPEDVGLPYLIDRYSFGCWNYSKIFRDRPDPPRFYGNVFRDAAGLAKCLYHGDQEMYHELYYVDKFSNLRIAYEIQRRSMLAAILGTVINDLKDTMPKLRLPFKVPRVIRLNIPGLNDCISIPIMNRTERAKREALYSLDYRFFSLSESDKLPLAFFPCPDHLADVLVYKDIDKLDYVNPQMIQIARGIAEEDCVRIISRLRESYPSHVLDFDPECSMKCAKEGFGFVVNKKNQTMYDMAFDAMRPDMEDCLDVETIVDSLMPLNLPPGAVCRISWLSDIDKDGKLSREEFYTSMHLAMRKMHGLEIPIKLPQNMVACLKIKKTIETGFRRMTELGQEELPKLFYPDEHPAPLCPAPPPPPPPPPPPKEKPKSMMPDWGNMFRPPPKRVVKPGTIDSLLEGGDHIWQPFASGKKKFRDIRIQEDLLTFGGWRATGSMSHFFSFL